MSDAEVLRRYIRLINDHDVAGMVGLMTEDHRFTDAVGESVSGRGSMRDAWIGYFRWFPDYRIEIEETYSHGDTFVLLGTASGTSAGGERSKAHWRIPAAWRAVVRRRRIKEWSVFCDTKVPYDTISASE